MTKLTLAVVGDRNYSDYEMFSKVLTDELERFPAERIVTGDATGVDYMVRRYCDEKAKYLTIYSASKRNFESLTKQGYLVIDCSDWATQGNKAGPIRNASLVDSCHRVLLFDGGGPGSRSVRSIADKLGKEVEVWKIDNQSSQN